MRSPPGAGGLHAEGALRRGRPAGDDEPAHGHGGLEHVEPWTGAREGRRWGAAERTRPYAVPGSPSVSSSGTLQDHSRKTAAAKRTAPAPIVARDV